MANSKDNLSNRMRQLSGATLDGKSLSKLLTPTDLLKPSTSGTQALLRAGKLTDTRLLSFSAKESPSGISFGKPSSMKSTTSTSGSVWTNLLTHASSGGLTGALTGGFGAIGGIASLVSGIMSLFGGGSGKNNIPPLVQFQLPASQDETLYVASKGVSSSGTLALNPTEAPSVQNTTRTQTPANQPVQYRSGEIAQAVKNALLNSSSLNDVIAEI